jgi:hypothetical protein
MGSSMKSSATRRRFSLQRTRVREGGALNSVFSFVPLIPLPFSNNFAEIKLLQHISGQSEYSAYPLGHATAYENRNS